MKENLKWIILGASIIIAACIYVLGTRYQTITVQTGFGGSSVVIYDRITGNKK
jgi:hypothetical protein